MRKLTDLTPRPRAAQIFAAIIAGIITVSMVLTFGIIYVLLKLRIGTLTTILTSSTYMGMLTILLGTEPNSDRMQNKRSIKLLSAKETKTKTKGLLYNSDGTVEGLYDSWGSPFTVVLNVEDQETLQFSLGSKPYSLKGRRAAVYSPGADKKLGTSDDIRSW